MEILPPAFSVATFGACSGAEPPCRATLPTSGYLASRMKNDRRWKTRTFLWVLLSAGPRMIGWFRVQPSELSEIRPMAELWYPVPRVDRTTPFLNTHPSYFDGTRTATIKVLGG